MNALNALAAGDFRALMDGLLSDDRIEGQVGCPCGQLNTVILVRTGCVVVTYIDANTVHGDDVSPEDMDVVSYRSVATAVQAMDRFRAEMDQLNGMTQLINAVNGAVGQGGDFMVI